ncbi:Glycosyltransferase involved in cell wall bisynthesis [Arenibacter palladensis]|uniref:Glycosyltransferase involved in cell wall bisynthesis n=1 Tax=Arenibacter palladensis TaxID=237373 RepID=A0A1M5HN75_9FLAO|nr:glycosyltransferase family 1 protein [Arenibacter palladensis]SHG17400.1 Glycosyltransferase involved in cell wall bisynthesis [Arenibacter palladensis]
MKINYFFRHPGIGHSIHRVFRTLIEELDGSFEISIHEVPCEGSKPIHILWNNIFVHTKRDKQAINHITGHIHDVILALTGTKTILTIHDLVFLDNVKNPIKRFYKWLFWLYLPLKIADKVVCISNQTKRNILSKIYTNKLLVIYNAVDPIFNHQVRIFNQDKPVILHIGTGWNKNLNRTIEALNGITCHLRIIGKLYDSQIELLENNNIEYSNQFDLTDEDIRNEYVNCDIVNFPSLYEGFGMPIIEGQQTGRVVVTSKIEPLIEVSCGAAAFVKPDNIHSIRQAYLNVISDESYRTSLIEKGLENAKRFSVKNISHQYKELYQNIARA